MKKITWNSPVILSFALISLIALGLNTATNGATNQLLFSVYGGSLLNSESPRGKWIIDG